MGAIASYLAGDDGAAEAAAHDGEKLTAFREALRAEPELLILIGSEVRAGELRRLVEWGLTLPHAKFAVLGDYVNARGAAEMGLLPDLLPGYVPVDGAQGFGEEYGERLPGTAGMNLLQMLEAAGRGELAALYVVNANPVGRFSVDPAALKGTFIVAHEMFLTETAKLADVVFPAANLYEKSGSVVNSYGDLQLVKKAADRAGVRSDLELLVRVADRMGADIKQLVPFGKRSGTGLRADLGQTRGVQSGEADRHAVWLTANNLEPKLSPFDPFAVLDEIQRLVPGYDLLRLQLLSGNDQHLAPSVSAELVQIDSARADLVLPAEDTLFTSGTLGRYSPKLVELQRKYAHEPVEMAAD